MSCPSPLQLRASRRLLSRQTVQSDQQSLELGEAPVACELLISIDAEQFCELVQLILRQARVGEALLRIAECKLHTLALRM